MTTLADRLKEAMADRDASDSDLAKACGVSPQAVFRWTKGGKIKADNLAAAAKWLKVRHEWLRSGKGPKKASDVEMLDANTQRVIELMAALQAPLSELAQAISEISKFNSDQQASGSK